MFHYDNFRKKIEELNDSFKSIKDISEINEANTRFKFINELVKYLSWETDDIIHEDRYDGKYADYILKIFRPIAVVEAKKSGIYFELPSEKKYRLYRPIISLYKDNKNFKDAIDQVMGYCQRRGIGIGIISNGWQIIAFLANRTDSIPPLDGKALIVPSFECLIENSQEVWNCLSKNGFEEGYLIRKLSTDLKFELPPKLSSNICNYPGKKARNPFQRDLETLSEFILEDVINEHVINEHDEFEENFLTSCYCKSGALSKYTLVSKELLLSRYSYLFQSNRQNVQQVADSKGVADSLKEIVSERYLSKRPILLIGDIGVGKSTFINYLMKVEACDIFASAFSFKVDLGFQTILALDLKREIVNIINKQLFENYGINIEEDNFVRHCYHVELERFRESVSVKRLYGTNDEEALKKEIDFLESMVKDNKLEHLKKSLEYLSKSQKKQIIIFIDNCDQRNDKDQQEAFLISQELASHWPAAVFVSLRPETFQRARKENGALSAYSTRTFSIPPPRLDEVIKKRLNFAKKIANNELSSSFSPQSHVHAKSLYDLIEIFLNSLDKKPDIMELLNNVSNENVRKALEMIKKFFGSGHVNTEKILRIYEKEGSYTIPIHEFLRSVIYEDNEYYLPENLEIVNLFDVRHNKSNEHFITSILISMLAESSKNNRNYGFISIRDIYDYLQGLGYIDSQVDSVLNFAYGKKLFELCPKGDILDLPKADLKIRATNSAMYHFYILTKLFSYIDAIIVDTPIFENDFKERILNVNDIEDRLERANIFREYLNNEWSKLQISPKYFNWNNISYELKKDIDRIGKRIAYKSELSS